MGLLLLLGLAGVILDLIRRLVRKIYRSQKRKSRAEWPATTADVFEWAVIPALGGSRSEGSLRIRATLAITVSGQRHYGLLHSIGMGESPARKFLKEADKPSTLPVRYNPQNPEEMIVLPEKGVLPFELDTIFSS